MKEDLELNEFRELMPPPDRWEEGFGVKAMIGGLFVGMIMTPASMYMQLVVGADIGSAAQWVTIILFIEVARRAFTTLTRPESLRALLHGRREPRHAAAGCCGTSSSCRASRSGSSGLAEQIPSWVAPSSPEVLAQRSFFHPAWYVPIGLIALGQFLQRVDHFGLGYVMYRLTSDVEKLPFPMAPVRRRA